MTDDFYDKEFVCGQSTISRAELESLPCPFCTVGIDDATMQNIIDCVEMDTRQSLRLSTSQLIDFNNDRHNEVWWECLEHYCRYFQVPYYEDLDE